MNASETHYPQDVNKLYCVQVELEDEEVKQILESLVFDGFAVRLHTLGEGGKKVTFYRAIKNQPLTSGEKWDQQVFL